MSKLVDWIVGIVQMPIRLESIDRKVCKIEQTVDQVVGNMVNRDTCHEFREGIVRLINPGGPSGDQSEE